LGILLRLREPGETIELSLVRSGKQLSIELTLERLPDARAAVSVSPMEITLVPTGVRGMPKQIIYPQSKTAELSREDGAVATLHYEDEVAHVRIVDAKGEEIYAGPVRRDGHFSVPDGWKCSVGALLRSMHQAGKSDRHPRSPRPRVVIPSESKER